MTVFDSLRRPIAHTFTQVNGVPFVYGNALEISIRGYSIAALPGEFLRAMREGETYLVEDAGEKWRLHQVVFHGENGMMVEAETTEILKEGSVVG